MKYEIVKSCVVAGANWRNRRLLESREINICQDPLNRDDGIHLPHEHLNLTLIKGQDLIRSKCAFFFVYNAAIEKLSCHFPLMKDKVYAETLGF